MGLEQGRGVRRTRRAMTLGEVVLAVALLGLVISSLLLLFLTLMSSSVKSSHLATGVMEAERVLEMLCLRAEGEGLAPPATLTGADDFYSPDAQMPTRFTYDVTSTQLATSSMGTSWWVQVTVRWWSTQPNQSRAGSGQLFVHRGRMVYQPR